MDLSRPSWYVGTYESKLRHGFGAMFAVSEQIIGCPTVGTNLFRQYRKFPVRLLDHGWWERGVLVLPALPVPLSALARDAKFNTLREELEVSGQSLSVTVVYDDEQGTSSIRMDPPASLANFKLLCSSSRIEADSNQIMLYEGEVAEVLLAAHRTALLPHGSGRWLTMNNRTLQSGSFREGWLHHQGERTDEHGNRLITNNFLRGIPTGVGKGQWWWEHGKQQSYAGMLLGEKPHGIGEMRDRNGGYYRGSFADGLAHGVWGVRFLRPRQSDSLSSLYRGGWSRGLRSGLGFHRRPDGSEYVGDWLHNKAHGTGRRTEPDGSVLDGQWSGGMLHGFGVQLDATGTITRCGQWKEGRLKRAAPVPLSSLSHALRSSLPRDARLVDKSPFSTSLIFYTGFTDGALPHGTGKWNLEADTGFTRIAESARMEAPACFAQTQSPGSPAPRWSAGSYVRGVLSGFGSRWYPNGDHYCGPFIRHRDIAAPDGFGVVFINATGRFVEGRFHAGQLITDEQRDTGVGATQSWAELDCYAHSHPSVLGDVASRVLRRHLPLFSQDPSSGHFYQLSPSLLMEGHMASAACPVAFGVWWNVTTGRLDSSYVDFTAVKSTIPVTPNARLTAHVIAGGALMSIAVNTNKLYEKQAATTDQENVWTARVSVPVPTPLLWNVTQMTPAASLSALIQPAGAFNCSYRYYSGQLNADLSAPSGRGVWFCSDGRELESGRYVHGSLHGLGTRVFPNGDHYHGFFLDDQPHGWGTIAFHNGNVYNGSFVHGRRESSSNSADRHVVSEWLIALDSTACRGAWRDDLPHGLISCQYANGSRWSGHMIAGARMGSGALWLANGSIVHAGLWNADAPVDARSSDAPFNAGSWIPAATLLLAFSWLDDRFGFLASNFDEQPILFGQSVLDPLRFRIYSGRIACYQWSPSNATTPLDWWTPHGFGQWMESDGTQSESGLYVAGVLRWGSRLQQDGAEMSGFFVAGTHWSEIAGAAFLSCSLLVLSKCVTVFGRWLLLADARVGFSSSVRDCWYVLCYGSLPLALYLDKRSLHGFVDTGDHHLVYRSLRPDEVVSIEQHGGISAKAPKANRSVEEHVRLGSDPDYLGDQFISATTDLRIARLWTGVFGRLAILRDSGDSPVINLSSQPARLQHLRDADGDTHLREHTHAGRAREVIFSRSIPARHVALCSMLSCRVVQQWPPLSFELVQLPQMFGLFPEPDEHGMLDVSPEAWIVRPSVGHKHRLRRLEHRGTGRQYLSHCGASNLDWTSTFEQPLASTRQLIVQCQSDLIAQMIYRTMVDDDDIDNFPPCRLYLCQLTHAVMHKDAQGKSRTVMLPPADANDCVPLLLYACPSDVSTASVSAAPAGSATSVSFQHTLFLDALLMVTNPAESSVLSSAAADDEPVIIRRFDHYRCLDKRTDDDPKDRDVIPLIQRWMKRHANLYASLKADKHAFLALLSAFLGRFEQHRAVILALLDVLQSSRCMERTMQQDLIHAEEMQARPENPRSLLNPLPLPLDLKSAWMRGIEQLHQLRTVCHASATVADALRTTRERETAPPIYADHDEPPRPEEEEHKGEPDHRLL